MNKDEVIRRLWKDFLTYYSDHLIENGDSLGWEIHSLKNLPLENIIEYLNGRHLSEFIEKGEENE